MRGSLPKEVLEFINSEIPSIRHLQKLGFDMNPELISMAYSPRSEIPITAVCFQDAVAAINSANIALHELLAVKNYYQKPEDNEISVTLQKFYAEDLSFRLYGAAEDLAQAIIYMLEIKDVDLKPFRKRSVSKQSSLGKYLRATKPNHIVTLSISKLVDSQEWNKSMSFRSKWTHEQPYSISGMGIEYRRRIMWKETEDPNRHVMPFGGRGDPPDYDIEEVELFLKKGLSLFIQVIEEIMLEYRTMLKKVSVTVGEWLDSN